MNDKELGLEVFEKADDEEMKRIAADCPASDAEKERMFKLSQKIYSEKTNEISEAPAEVVSGVEQYKKPIWHKIVSAAAALALVAGLGTGGYLLARRSGGNSQFAGGDITLSDAESKVSNYPFGEIDRVRMTCSAIAPAVIELEPEKVSELASLLEEESWEETDEPNMADGEYYMLFFYNNGKSYELIIMPHNNIQFDTLVASDGKIYIGGSRIYDFLHTIKLEPDDFLYDMDDDSAEEVIKEVWTFGKKDITIDESSVNDEKKPIPDFTAMNIELAKEQLKELGFNSQVKKEKNSEIQPNYVIKTEPEAGTELRKGGTVTLYVSQGAEDEKITVDDFTGKDIDEAVNKAVFTGGNVSYFSVPSNEEEGTVVEQYPAAGTEITKDTDIILYVSEGSITEGEVAYRFIIPKDTVLGSGRYSIDFIYEDEDGKINAVTAGTHELTPDVPVFLYRIQGKGNGKKVTAVITDEKTDKKANLGHYIFDFDNGTYTIEDEDIEGAFEATGY
ncbi:PASTA domain-containing protein [Ruminococcus flavefaciens]|uniref:PASTA domain-containing protein n=1 Tax=Ruminococcus flavefaciens TaxID=1265 RepID=UPI000464CC68|nr:PASTA domain-containing protein [Ruminococcus flavefaciens]